MAKKSPHPGRTVVVFFLGLVIIFGLVALGGTWKPALGLDLQGGTRITLSAKGSPTADSMQEAADIIDQRVNGSGVNESEVAVQGNKYIVVEIPGKTRNDLVDLVARQAQLRFRLVALQGSGAPGAPSTNPTDIPGTGVTAPPTPTASATAPSASASSTPKSRVLPKYAAPSATASPSGLAAAEPSSTASASPGEDSTVVVPPTESAETSGGDSVDAALAFMNNPDQASVTAYNAFSCPADGTLPVVDDDPTKPLVTCDDEGTKYLLSKPIIEGTQLKGASAQIPPNEVAWAVTLDLNSDGAKVLSQVSNALKGDQSKLFAITLDGSVISSAYFSQAINDGNAQISGNFTQQSAKDLSTSLKFGSLPIAFEDDPTKEEIGPSLAGDQLSAGITAGIIGLALVMIYCLFYYRGLGLVVIASLVVAAITTYGLVLLLAKTAGFTLTLPGIAGLIVAVGITADSFVVFFERIRDEMREGKSMRVAVESGWVRARNTCLAADSVSLLAAVVLYIFAAGVVKGFAFALGLSTLIDLVVFFWFTKPMVSWLGHFSFFNKGHRLSGLDAENLGLARPAGATVGGKA